jgi:hypothetical protein
MCLIQENKLNRGEATGVLWGAISTPIGSISTSRQIPACTPKQTVSLAKMDSAVKVNKVQMP